MNGNIDSMDMSLSKPQKMVKDREAWSAKELMLQIVVLEKTLESPLDNKKIRPVNPKGNQS